jgi:hypothetical protein
MSKSRNAALPLLLGLFATTACWDLGTGDDFCFHSEGCPEFVPDPHLVFTGTVTAAVSGEALTGVTVRIEVPARGWSETTVTDSRGLFVTQNPFPNPAARDCAELSVSFSAPGYQPLRVSDFPGQACLAGLSFLVNVSLTPSP